MIHLRYAIFLTLFIQQLVFSQTPQSLEKKQFEVCGKKLLLELADSDSERSIGLMHRNEVPVGTGMIFVFPYAQPLSFWMKNVPMDIDIGYFSASGKLVSYHTMKGTSPLQNTEQLATYPSQLPAKYAVEVETGFYKKYAKKNHCILRPLP